MTDPHPPPARPRLGPSGHQAFKRAIAGELSFVRAIVTLALPIAVGNWNLTLGWILAVPCIAFFGWQVVQSWRRFVRGR
jgi:hypothetical protein